MVVIQVKSAPLARPRSGSRAPPSFCFSAIFATVSPLPYVLPNISKPAVVVVSIPRRGDILLYVPPRRVGSGFYWRYIHPWYSKDEFFSSSPTDDQTETIYTTLTESKPGVDYFNATSAGQVQKKRLADDILANPGIINTIKEFIIRTRGPVLYLSVMDDPVTPKKYVSSPAELFTDAERCHRFVDNFFREERLPVKEGWTKSTTLITSQTITSIADIIEETSKWVDNGVCPII
ncbi:hypothetical protein DFS33DRAFT_1288556 [Desarmillaria ectypa]|nr:hypothetical protein DFS33DRAFT_1288556 [Desarmillaria ectypa]